MENNCRNIIQNFLRKYIRIYRLKAGISQEKMAEYLHISPRAYISQEHGEYGFSSMPVIFFLFLLSDNEVLEFLEKMKIYLDEEIANTD